ncbi:MFS transporter [Xanthocytophaga agilis]|uniref:MFS transporter n=1 Tax=Xanthocytophaga agilis TaxID=3048010 RepID=A0AAE3RAD9_9BACT|nr:MFS transporter [Xanthocytophaga agilis]MDJ1506624.1 MFS transporter [Xanthocytophaga agilis]
MVDEKHIKSSSQKGLDYLNFFLADVRAGIGPYLSIYLLSIHHWSLKDIGIVSSVGSLAGVLAQTPAGALVDRLASKHSIIVIASLMIGGSVVWMLLDPIPAYVVISQLIIGIAAAFLAPAVASLTLGIFGYAALEKRMGRNETFNHAGNVVAACLSGFLGYFFHIKAVFVLIVFMCVASICSLKLIDKTQVDSQLARGYVTNSMMNSSTVNSSGLADKNNLPVLLQNKQLVIFTLCCLIYHFSNAAMLPLAGQYIVIANKVDASVYMSACIVIAQLVMVPVAFWCGKEAKKGRKPLLFLCFLILPFRGFLYLLSSNPFYIVSIQVLDGVSAGIFGVVSILILSDLTKGTGHFNLVNGLVATAIGLGASMSNLTGNWLAESYSFPVAFLCLASIALLPVLLSIFFFKESYSEDNLFSIQSIV